MPNLKTGQMEPIITALTDEEEEQFRNMMKRLNHVFEVGARSLCVVWPRATCFALRLLASCQEMTCDARRNEM